jgi:hypothetical protein
VGRSRARRDDHDLVHDEVRATVALLRLACEDARRRLAGADGSLAAVAAADRRVLADQLEGVMEEHRRLWTARFRPGGLDDSLAWFDHLADCYATGETDPAWFGPA